MDFRYSAGAIADNGRDYALEQNKILISVEVVLLTIKDGRLMVLLSKRLAPPFLDFWTLPSEILRQDIGERGEDPNQTVFRILKNEINFTEKIQHKEQLKTYATPNRDPREQRVVSIAYLCIGADLKEPKGAERESLFTFTPIEEIMENEGDLLAFDHFEIISDAVNRTKAKLEYSSIGCCFCSQKFTIGELRRVYEIIWNTALDAGNFQRKVLSSPGFLTDTGLNTVSTQARGRPGKLYHAGSEEFLKFPIRY